MKKFFRLFIEGRVGKIDILLIESLFGQLNGFAEPLEVHDFPLPQKADHVIHIRIIGQAEDIVVGEARFLLWCDLVRTTFFVDGIGFLYVVCYYVDRSSNMSKLHLKGI